MNAQLPTLRQAMMCLIRSALSFAAICLLPGCQMLEQPREVVTDIVVQGNDGQSRIPRRIAVFFDGTSNDSESGTNTAALHDLVQKSGQATTFYIEGVGAKGKPIGMAMAWGIGMRVHRAYTFLLNNYQPGDQIYLFGFSRGAYSARILASMLYHAGLPAKASINSAGLTSGEVANLVFGAFKCSTWSTRSTCEKVKAADRISSIDRELGRVGLPASNAVEVRFLGLWDTVEALGWPDYEVNVDNPNPRYGDQLCNVRRAAHAVSLDDNRSRIFTPILLTREHLFDACGARGAKVYDWKQLANEKVDEVYFAGAHADVGGGYEDGRGKLSGVSLNWMIEKASAEGLVIGRSDSDRQVPQDPSACTHDPQAGFPWNLLYKRLYRPIDQFANDRRSSSRVLKFHPCLVQHIAHRPRGLAEYAGADKLAMPGSIFSDCFKIVHGKLEYARSPSCRITIEGESCRWPSKWETTCQSLE